MVIHKLLALYEITNNVGFLVLAIDIMVDDKCCHKKDKDFCDCITCDHCERCKGGVIC